MNESQRYIKTVVDGLYRGAPSAYTYLLERGREWGPRIYPRDVHQGTPKQCYTNAYDIACRLGYKYVEGVALAIIPVDHAWCVDSQGRVIDPTWEPGTGSDYFGVMIPMGRLNRIVVATLTLGVFDSWDEIQHLLPGAIAAPAPHPKPRNQTRKAQGPLPKSIRD